MSDDHRSVGRFESDERAQTVQDFAVGISIFLLVVGAVFLMFPSLFTPYEQAISDEGPDSQADRIGMLIADNVSDGEATNELTEEELEYWFEKSDGDLQDAVAVSSSTQVNVTLTTMNATNEGPIDLDDGAFSVDKAAAGPDPGDRDTSTAARIVTVEDSATDGGTEPAYRLVVRVW